MAKREYAFYPGCSSQLKGSASNYLTSVNSMCETLDIKMTPIPDWNCCGASIGYAGSGELARHVMNARNFALADEHLHGQDVVATCAACWLGAKETKESTCDRPCPWIPVATNSEYKRPRTFHWSAGSRNRVDADRIGKFGQTIGRLSLDSSWGGLEHVTRAPSLTSHAKNSKLDQPARAALKAQAISGHCLPEWRPAAPR